MKQVWRNSHLFHPTEEHRQLRNMLSTFVRQEVETQALLHDRHEKFNLKLFKKLGTLGLLGLTVEAVDGGTGMDALASVIVHEELSRSDPGLCLAYIAHAILCAHNIAQNANKEQKARWLPKLISGEWVGAMAMSEAGAGTDVLGMQSQWTSTKDHFILNGRKMWITNGIQDENNTPADLVLVYAQRHKKISTFIVEKSFKGYRAGQKIQDKMGMRASTTAELVFDNCLVPKNNLIGGEGESGQHMMHNLEIERLCLSAMSLGIAGRCLHEMNKYASERHAFGQSLRHFGQIQKYIAESYAEYMACRTYVYHVAKNLNLKQSGQRLETDTAKLMSARMGRKVANRAIQVLGAYGYVGEYHIERLYRDARLLEMGGGTNEALHKNISKDLNNRPL